MHGQGRPMEQRGQDKKGGDQEEEGDQIRSRLGGRVVGLLFLTLRSLLHLLLFIHCIYPITLSEVFCSLRVEA